MSIARFTQSIFNLTDDPIIDGFKSVHGATTLELIERFLRDGNEQALILFEDRFKEDKVWIPEEHRYKTYGKYIPEIETPVRELIQTLDKKYQQDPKSLAPREIALLGKAYEFGIIVERNTVKAHHLYMEVAEKCPLVAVDLGIAFYYGANAFAQDKDRGLKYFEWARDQSVAIASTALGFIHQGKAVLAEQKLKVSENPKDQEAMAAIKQDYLIARKYLETAAGQSEPCALYHLGRAHREGTGYVEYKENKTEGQALLQRSAILGNAAALTLLGGIAFFKEKPHDFRLAVKQLNIKSLSYFFLAAEFGYHEARYLIGLTYYLQNKFFSTAVHYFENSDRCSLTELGRYHLQHPDGDANKAVIYLRKAMEKRRNGFDALRNILNTQVQEPLPKRNPIACFHSAMALREEKSLQDSTKKVMTDLAQDKPDEFENLSKWEPWTKLQPLLEKKTAKAVLDKKNAKLETTLRNIGEGAPKLFPPLKEIVVGYVADMHPNYLEDFFQSRKKESTTAKLTPKPM